ncbi:MAG: hypothetical protein AAF762_01095 [Pseudomonadota bacterium]
MHVERREVPAASLISPYVDGSNFVDAYFVARPGVALPNYVDRFFTTPIFRLERSILRLTGGVPSEDQQVAALASGTGEVMASWRVEARSDDELLLVVPGTPIRTWLAVDDRGIWFGSVIVAGPDGNIPFMIRALIPFHALYSRVLLWAAARRMP